MKASDLPDHLQDAMLGFVVTLGLMVMVGFSVGGWKAAGVAFIVGGLIVVIASFTCGLTLRQSPYVLFVLGLGAFAGTGAYLLWKAIAYSAGATMSWWKWLTGHF
jgi:hypothetical protein